MTRTPFPVWPLAACLLALLAACSRPPADDAGRKARVEKLFAEAQKDFPAAPGIAPEEAVALWRQGRLLPLDIRTPAERAVSALPGAVTEEAFRADPALAAGKVAVAYCTIGYRSGLFVQNLGPGHPSVANLAGGILGWLHAGGTLTDPAGRPTTRVHVYGRAWDLAPLAYTPVW
ncbi:Rhodanese-like protein [Solidesulfovibrio carbinoliphilus subsp. oakridgensis]|uniref:Rhodanese-like protein n=1 Tax=Solidesulfovibrio carbinoliphilus subsp. oakridgensis TaxID=694327 RepID=G7Q4J3_9BACT|nr:rhodanese-like domain-containing protein [Solidesulfovibrio carbinoliphilus]EHJ47216.1 Rhodanese-like protein [Solidesulfovibrio carbinoliphilus subsp. oakridgensis]